MEREQSQKYVHTMKTIIRKGLQGFGKAVGCEDES